MKPGILRFNFYQNCKVMKIRSLIVVFTLAAFSNPRVLSAQDLLLGREQIIALTTNWEGGRFADGRPKVSDDILNRTKNVSIEQAWSVLRNNGYKNQFCGEWIIIHPDQAMVGRALTAQYMPKRVAIREVLEKRGVEKGYIGDMVSWPIDLLQEGDLYVADSYGKINEGPIIGDNLGTR